MEHGDKSDGQRKLMQHKYQGKLSYSEFCMKLKANAERILLRRNITREFLIDSSNAVIIQELYLYFIGDRRCRWNLHAGLIVAGKVGCGKTLLMKAYIELSNSLISKQVVCYHSMELVEYIAGKGIEDLKVRPIFIDEMGREVSEVNDYGTVKKPIVELLAVRYENGGRTYGTTNLKKESLGKVYSEFILSRLLEMCNYVVMGGESRREVNEF